MDFKDLAANLGIDEEDFIELVELFITTTRSDMEKIEQSLSSDNAEGAAAASHSIKGAAGNLGFMTLFEIAQTMEMEAKAGDLSQFSGRMQELEQHVVTLENKMGS